ncbi:MAG TPA: insulinase family protein [Thermodesulfobium narugense]|nr:insulinase family protein [Thermodesulfobium narugense]
MQEFYFPEFKVIELKNSLKIVLIPIFESNSIVTSLYLKVGSALEDYNTNGLSHFLEHLLFKGTKKRSAYDIFCDIESVGGEINAATSNEYTVFYTYLPYDSIELSLDMISDIVFHPVFPVEEVDKERLVVLEEMKRSYDRIPSWNFNNFLKKSFPESTLGFPIIGREEVISNIEYERIIEFYKKFYVPSNSILVISGKFDEKEALDLSEKYFGVIPDARKNFFDYSVDGFPEKVFFVEKRKDIKQASLIYGFRTNGYRDRERVIFDIVDAYLGSGGSSVLFQEIREKRGLAYDISTFNYVFKKASVFGVISGLNQRYLNEAIEVIRKEIERLKKEGIDEQELSRLKRLLRGRYLLDFETNFKISSLIGKHILFDEIDYLMSYLEKLDKISPEQILEVVNESFDFDREIICLIKRE